MADKLITADTPLKELQALRATLDARIDIFADALTAAEALDEVIRLRQSPRTRSAIAAGHKRVTLCGSQRFAAQFEAWHATLMIDEGAMVHTAPRIGAPVSLAAHEKEAIDLLWFAMIAESDEVFVVDCCEPGQEPYIGESTAEEIAFATERGIPVRYLSKETGDG